MKLAERSLSVDGTKLTSSLHPHGRWDGDRKDERKGKRGREGGGREEKRGRREEKKGEREKGRWREEGRERGRGGRTLILLNQVFILVTSFHIKPP